MGWGFAAAAVGSALLGNRAAKKQASAAQNAANQANKVALDIFNMQRKDNAPFRNTGVSALYQLAALDGVDYNGAPGTAEQRRNTALQRFYNSPDYQYRLTQGINALDKSAAARGRLQSGDHVKSVIGYSGDLASGEYNNWRNSLRSMAGVGQVAAGANSAAAGAYASSVGSNLMSAGATRGSAYANQAASLNGLISDIYKQG
ncbi:MAG: hypothetical protein R3261_01310 [Alphaproteobacteria bacterium]|nr:hypothetical protein [Alphaproteobacteria bacterium]